MNDEYSLIGTPDKVAEGVQAYVDIGADQIICLSGRRYDPLLGYAGGGHRNATEDDRLGLTAAPPAREVRQPTGSVREQPISRVSSPTLPRRRNRRRRARPTPRSR